MGNVAVRHDGHAARIRAAAAVGDVVTVLDELHSTGIFDGLVRRIESDWPSASSHADLIVSEAVDVLWESLRKGERVDDPLAFVYKVAWRKAYHRDQQDSSRALAETAFSELREFDTDPGVRLRRRAKRIEALRIARSLLSQVGQANAQRVMACVLDAVERDRSDISIAEIAEIVGISEDAARKNLERGLERLARAARDAGLLPTDQHFIVLSEDTVLVDED